MGQSPRRLHPTHHRKSHAWIFSCVRLLRTAATTPQLPTQPEQFKTQMQKLAEMFSKTCDRRFITAWEGVMGVGVVGNRAGEVLAFFLALWG